MDLIFFISDSIELTSVQDDQEALPIFGKILLMCVEVRHNI